MVFAHRCPRSVVSGERALRSSRVLANLLISCLAPAILGCGTSTIGVRDVSPRTADTYEREQAQKEKVDPASRSFPPCAAEAEVSGGKPLPPPVFPASSEGADYRAILLLTIGEDGSAQEICFRRAEGPLRYEEKALADRAQWKYSSEHAGQKREKVVTFRLSR